MIKEGIYEFIARQKISLISSVGEEGYPATRAMKFSGFEAQWFASKRTQTIKL